MNPRVQTRLSALAKNGYPMQIVVSYRSTHIAAGGGRVHAAEASPAMQSHNAPRACCGRGDGAEPVGNTPDGFRAYIEADVVKWAKVIDAVGVRLEP